MNSFNSKICFSQSLLSLWMKMRSVLQEFSKIIELVLIWFPRNHLHILVVVLAEQYWDFQNSHWGVEVVFSYWIFHQNADWSNSILSIFFIDLNSSNLMNSMKLSDWESDSLTSNFAKFSDECSIIASIRRRKNSSV